MSAEAVDRVDVSERVSNDKELLAKADRLRVTMTVDGDTRASVWMGYEKSDLSSAVKMSWGHLSDTDTLGTALVFFADGTAEKVRVRNPSREAMSDGEWSFEWNVLPEACGVSLAAAQKGPRERLDALEEAERAYLLAAGWTYHPEGRPADENGDGAWFEGVWQKQGAEYYERWDHEEAMAHQREADYEALRKLGGGR